MLSLQVSEPSSEDQEEFLGLSPHLSPVSHLESDLIEEVPEAGQASIMIVPAFIERQDSAPFPTREIIPLRAFTAISTSSAGS